MKSPTCSDLEPERAKWMQGIRSCGMLAQWPISLEYTWYPLVNVYIARENHHYKWVNQL
jgi:hypothetical protein